MRHTTKALMLVLAVLLAIPAASFAGNGNGQGQDKQDARNDDVSDVDECNWDNGDGEAGTASFTGLTNLWPPNHKYTGGHAVEWALTDPEADQFEGDFGAGHDQAVDGEEINGSGNTSEDIKPGSGVFGNVSTDEEGNDTVDTDKRLEVVDFQIRAERSGTDQDGRVYSISGGWVITDNDTGRTATCTFEFFSYVPHDQGNRNNGGAPEQDPEVEDAATAVMSFAS